MEHIYVTIGKGSTFDTFMPPHIRKRLESIGNVKYNNEAGRLTEEQLGNNLADIDICVTGWGCPKFTGEVLHKADKLKLIAHTGGSVANHIGKEVFERGVRVVTGNDIFAVCVAEGTLAYILAGLRRLVLYANNMQKGMWADDNWYNESLIGQPVGLVGFGAIARHLVAMLRPFGCKISAYDPFVEDEIFENYGVNKASLTDIATQSKVVSIHASKTDGSHHIIDREFLSSMHDGTLFVNTARGAVVDEEALADEAVSGRIHMVLDVYEREPLPKDSRLRNLPNVTLIPHMGGPTIDKREYVTKCILDDIERFLRGEKLMHEVDCSYALRMTKE